MGKLTEEHLEQIQQAVEMIRSRRDGGKGSGNWGHAGRAGAKPGEGKLGGSKKGTGGIRNRIAVRGGGFTSAAKLEAKAKKAESQGASKDTIFKSLSGQAGPAAAETGKGTSAASVSVKRTASGATVRTLTPQDKAKLQSQASRAVKEKKWSDLPQKEWTAKQKSNCAEIATALGIRHSELAFSKNAPYANEPGAWAEKSEVRTNSPFSPLTVGKNLEEKLEKAGLTVVKSSQNGWNDKDKDMVSISVLGKDGYKSTIYVTGPVGKDKDGKNRYSIQYGGSEYMDTNPKAQSQPRTTRERAGEILKQQEEKKAEEQAQAEKRAAALAAEKKWSDLPQTEWTSKQKEGCAEIADAIGIQHSELAFPEDASYAKEPGAWAEKSEVKATRNISTLTMGKHLEKKLTDAGLTVKTQSHKGWNSSDTEMTAMTVLSRDGYRSTIYVSGPVGQDAKGNYRYSIQYGGSEYMSTEPPVKPAAAQEASYGQHWNGLSTGP